MAVTQQIQRVQREQWLYRTAKGDYGPMGTDQILTAIRERAIDLHTEISVFGTNRWSNVAEVPLFRDHFEVCKGRWATEAAHLEAERFSQRMERRKAVSGAAWGLIGVGVVGVLAVAGWFAWRLLHAAPVGITGLASIGPLASLPEVPPVVRGAPDIPRPGERAVARLSEPESFDTAGVAIGVSAHAGGASAQMVFDEAGEVQEIPAAELARIVESARQALMGCGREALGANPAFAGTDVSFSVTSGGLTQVGVGGEVRRTPAFIACVKRVLRGVHVPAFQGSAKRVSVPVRVQR